MISRYSITFFLILNGISSIFSQVQNVKYGIKYIPATSYYDCYFKVSSGFAESSDDRILNDAKFSVKVETGTSISLKSSNLPFLNHEFYDGAEPVSWSISQSVFSPASDPEFDYYSFVPDLPQVSRFNDLFQNTEYNLFRISVEGSCVEGVQIFRNGIDPGSNGSGMGGKDFSNNISINSTNSLYSGLDEGTAFGADLRLDDVFSCDGDCGTLEIGGNCDLSNYTFLWSDGSTSSAVTVCPDMTTMMSVLVEGENGFSEQLTGEVNFVEPFVLNVFGSAICIGGELEMSEQGGRSGTWLSNNTDLAILNEISSNNSAFFSGLKEGVVSFTFIDDETSCVSVSPDIIVLPKLEIIPFDDTILKIGERLSFGTSEIYDYKAYWDVSPSDVAAIHDGVLYGLKPGACEVSFSLPIEYGCTSNSITVLVEENNICNDDGIKIWENIKIGDINEIIDIEASGASNKFFEGDENYSVIIYDGNTGNAILNRLDFSGQIVQESQAFTNSSHDSDSSYELELHDMDFDGLIDLVLKEDLLFGEERLYCYRNMGDGNFALEIVENLFDSDNLIELVDLDNDGFLDVISVHKHDAFYRVIFNNNWNSVVIDGTPGVDGTQYWIFTMDYNQDGLMDVVYQDQGILINNGNRTFTFDPSYDVAVSFIFRDRYLYDPESELLIGNEIIYSAEDVLSGEFTQCAIARIGGEINNFKRTPRFYANINSTTEKEIVVVGEGGFMSLNTSISCDEIGDGFKHFNFEGVSGKYNQIDIGNDGYTDFFYLEGNELYASINPNSNSDNIIKGLCYIDKNENGEYDADETSLRNVKIKTDQSNTVFLTDENGKFSLIPPITEFTLNASVTDGKWGENSLSISSEDVRSGCFETNYFGFVQSPDLPTSGSISISNSITRCDFETRFFITIENTGDEDAVFDLEFLFDEETSFMSSDIPNYSNTGQKLSASLGMLSPFASQTYKVTLKMPSGSSNLPMLNFGATLSSGSQLLDEYTYMEQLRCSYDPNDKRVQPDREGDDNLTLFEENLEYTIRFQNNGNDTAFTVRIVDALDPNIEPSSISVINSSHSVETCIDNDTIVFLFEDINLVDSMTNYVLSQGFVTFNCNAKEGIDENTIINNVADIIFDSNDPIITNTTKNTLVSEFCTDQEYNISSMICVGESINGYTESGVYVDFYTDINGCDSIVNLELLVSSYMTYSEDVLVCQGDTILINDVMISEPTTLIDTLESSTGCIDSIRLQSIQFVDEKEVTIDIEICEGDDFDGLTESGQYNFNLLSDQGCDSIVTLNLDVITPGSEDLFLLVCEGDSVSILDNDYQFFESTQFIDTVFNINNCPVEYTNVQITVTELKEISIDTTICEGEEYLGILESGNYIIDTIDQITGCPMTINLNLAVLPASDPNCTVSTIEQENFQIELFPNPANAQIVIKSDYKIESIQIFDTQFRKLFSMNTNATFAEISVREFHSGIYIIRCRMKDQDVYKKLIVQ
ncbi:MAG: putative repeat protein (TIGR01451 family) [Saprospiraceae bacterium]|jgi:uncharacterized repeat protein (TIGR01451 family)